MFEDRCACVLLLCDNWATCYVFLCIWFLCNSWTSC